MTKLVYVNPRKEDNCCAYNLEVLSKYMASRYIKANTYEVHHKYFIAIENTTDILAVLNASKISVYAIDYIVGITMICFKDEKSRDLVFNALKGEVM